MSKSQKTDNSLRALKLTNKIKQMGRLKTKAEDKKEPITQLWHCTQAFRNTNYDYIN